MSIEYDWSEIDKRAVVAMAMATVARSAHTNLSGTRHWASTSIKQVEK